MTYVILKTIVKIIVAIIFRVKIIGKESIPLKGACILCFNHTSYIDPPVIGVSMPRKLIFMAKDDLFKIPVLKNILPDLGVFPVKRGTGDISAIKKSLKILKEENALAMYPEGTRSKGGNIGNVKPGIAFIATKAQVPVIPVGVSGQYKLFHKILINVGKPIELNQYYNQKLSAEQLQKISNDIMDEIKQLVVSN